MKNILFATDFSEEAYCALYYASRLFEQEMCRFYITHFYGNEILTSAYGIVNEMEHKKTPALAQRSIEQCNEVKHRIKRDINLDNHQYEIISSRYKMDSEISFIATDRDIDLIVMGTKGHRGFMANWEKSNTSELIEKKVPCPILVVPKEINYKTPENISIASDLKKPFTAAHLQLLKELALLFNSDITVLYIGNEDLLESRQRANFNTLKSLLPGIEVKLECILSENEISKVVSDYVKNNSIDLLCMVYYKHPFTEKLFREPIIKNIDHHLSFPFLVFPGN